MVGLSILLENLELAQKSSSTSSGSNSKRSPQVINKITSRMNIINKPTSPSSSSCSSFLDACFLCNQRLMPGRDIYMYKGDRAFCSVECRCRQMVMDDEEINASRRDHNYCYFANSMTRNNNNSKPTSSSSSSSSRHHQRKPSESKNRGGHHGLFAY